MSSVRDYDIPRTAYVAGGRFRERGWRYTSIREPTNIVRSRGRPK